jgi:hypothetical protein
VLCGVQVDEVFDFGPPVTEAEAEERAGMLTAAIASAPILRDVSIDLPRLLLAAQGVFGARDGGMAVARGAGHALHHACRHGSSRRG